MLNPTIFYLQFRTSEKLLSFPYIFLILIIDGERAVNIHTA